MKKTFIFGLIAAVLGFSACSSEDDAILRENDTILSNGIHQGMVLNAIVEEPIDTRATIDASSTNWTFDFAEDDVVKVTNSTLSNIYYTFTKDAENFKSTDAQPTASAATWYAYFPSESIDLTGQTGTLAAVANKFAMAGKTASDVTGAESLSIALAAKVAILKIVSNGGPLNINVKNSATTWVTGLTAKSAEAGFEVVTSETKTNLFSTTAAGTYYIAVPAGMQLSIKDGDNVLKSTTTAGLIAGKYYTLVTNFAAWTEELSDINKSTATSISIETGKTKPATGFVDLNDQGTVWEVMDGTNLRIQTSADMIKLARSGFNLFNNFRNVTNIIGLASVDMSEVTDMAQMFMNCQALLTLDVSSFRTQNVFDMSNMFVNCESLTTLNLSSFNTQNVTHMSSMFSGCKALTSLDLTNLNTSKVQNMFNMFASCESLTTLDLSSFDTKWVANMCQMFFGCKSLTSLDLSSFNTMSVNNMSSMFWNCEALTSLDLSSFDTRVVMNMSQMFLNCQVLTSLNISSFNTQFVTNMRQMFSGCKSLMSLDLFSFNTENVSNMSFMFYDCITLTTLDLSSFDTKNVTVMSEMFTDCSNLQSLTLSNNFIVAGENYIMFKGCGQNAISGCAVKGVTDAALKTALRGCEGWSDVYMKFEGE